MRIAVSLLLLLASSSDAFTSLARCGSPSRFLGTQMRFTPHNGNSKRDHMQSSRRGKSSSSSSLHMFLGSDGGILGVGTPELATILLVGYFVLGPSDLYKLVKEIGKAVQNFRTLSSDAAKTFETSMESQIEFDEIRKAQRELNDAFSFRRSINVDQDEEAFTTTTTSEKIGAEPIRGDVGTKKKIRRRKKVIAEDKTDEDDDDVASVQVPSLSTSGNIPDLDMSYAFEDNDDTKLFDMQSEAEKVRAERLARLESSAKPPASDWFSDTMGNDNDSDADDDDDDDDMFAANAEAARFQAQLSNWNESILANEDKLSPLSKLMERLALLEEEKAAQMFRLEEEFRERADLEERFYRQKRELLEEAAAEIQASAYVNPDESVSSA